MLNVVVLNAALKNAIMTCLVMIHELSATMLKVLMLSDIVLSTGKLNITKFSVIMVIVAKQNDIILSIFILHECHNNQCRYTERALQHFAKRHST